MYSTFKALEALHSKKIVHLDIKLNNIVIDEGMKSFRFIDYGCAMILSSNDPQLQEVIPVCGSPGYCTPEM